jgi:5-methylcytosine-specific restriction endonuclease McrA
MAKRLYNDPRWFKTRQRFLRDNPVCVMCRQEGRSTRATVVDHVRPHKGDERLFWDVSNYQALCKLHHDSVKAREESSGRSVPVVGLDGWPIEEG